MESGEMAAATIVQALGRSTAAQDRALQGYPAALDAAYGGYYTLGRMFVKVVGNPHVMKQATRYGLPRQTLMRFTLKMMANLTDPRGGDVADRVINGLSRIAPAA
jgi:menaquinone-9 beta-reductase